MLPVGETTTTVLSANCSRSTLVNTADPAAVVTVTVPPEEVIVAAERLPLKRATSIPVPPSRVFEPPPPVSVSFPAPPVRVSFPAPPTNEFAPSFPTKPMAPVRAEASRLSAVVPVVAPVESAIFTDWKLVVAPGTVSVSEAVVLVKRIVLVPVPPSRESPVASPGD